MADKSEGCADIQRDFDRLEQQAERNHIKGYANAGPGEQQSDELVQLGLNDWKAP